MLETMFSFSGRLPRRAYAGYALLSSLIGVVAIFVAAFLGGLISAGGGKAAIVAGSAFAAVLAGIPMLWSSFALTAKRLRDAGFTPSIVMPAVIAFALFDMFVLSKHLAVVTHHGLANGTLAGLLVNVVYYGVVLFWPSAEGGSDTPARSSGSSSVLSRLDDPGALAAAYRASDRPEPIVGTAPAFAMPAAAMPGGSPPSFGRRRRV